jgi:hypothetical protein
MTIKEFIGKAKQIGCIKARIAVQVDACTSHFSNQPDLINYAVYCGYHKKWTREYNNPQDALDEFIAMHKPIKEQDEDMVVFEEDIPTFSRKAMNYPHPRHNPEVYAQTIKRDNDETV